MFEFEICTAATGWVFADVTPEHIEEAKRRYLERRKRCRAEGMKDKFTPDDMEVDHRWSGDLGEMFLKDYLEQRAYDHHWLANVRESEFDIDFLINRKKVDVKTKRRKRAPQNRINYFETVNHEQFITSKQPGREVESYAFCDYAYEDQQIFLTGAVSWAKFDAKKIWRPKGSQSNKCSISADSWDIPITLLMPPLKWPKAA